MAGRRLPQPNRKHNGPTNAHPSLTAGEHHKGVFAGGAQNGAALLTLIMFLVLGGLSFLVSRFSPTTIEAQRSQKTSDALVKAKEAIIAWSATNTALPGRLPCPENTSLIGAVTEGQAQTSCNTATPIGRLPWRTLGIGELRDGYGEPLWYALSGGFRNTPININTPALLTLDGASANVVAIVFSPGPQLAGQSRPTISAATPPVVANFQDLSNADGNTSFVSTGIPSAFNDRLLTITHLELFQTVGRRVAYEIRGDTTNGLQRYFLENGNTLPYAASTALGAQSPPLPNGYIPYGDLMYPGSAWLNANAWFPLAGYQRNTSNQATITIGSKAYVFTFP